MSPVPTEPVADHARWVYAGGLATVVAARVASIPGTARTTLVGLALGGMVLAFVAERWQAGDGVVDSPLAAGAGAVGVAVGGALSVAGRLAGLAFLAGGLAFLYRGLGGERG